jgi:hypothetical protein
MVDENRRLEVGHRRSGMAGNRSGTASSSSFAPRGSNAAAIRAAALVAATLLALQSPKGRVITHFKDPRS